MSLFLRELYLVKIPESFKNKKAFGEFLQRFFKKKLLLKVNIKDLEDTKITLVLRELPSFSVKSEVEPLIMYRSEDLEKLSPFSESFLSFDTSYADIISWVLDNIKVFNIKTQFGSAGCYFGISQEQILFDTPFKAFLIMKMLDFGNVELAPMNLFLPIFENIKRDLDILYKEFSEG